MGNARDVIQMRNCTVRGICLGDMKRLYRRTSSRIIKVARKSEGESPSVTVHEKAKLTLKTESQRCKNARICASLFQSPNEDQP